MRALFAKIREILRDRHLRRIWTRVISVMASVVVFISTYALILPAITMESEAACGIEAHQHTDECYEDVLTCGREESEDHQHTDACYTRTLICGKEAHIHSAECYKEDSSAVAVSGGTAVPAVTDGSAGDSSSDQSSGNHQTGQTSQPTQVDVSDASGPAADADGQGAGAEMSGTPENAGTTVTAEGLPADANTLSDGTGYVPVLDILNFDSLLTRETGFYYFHAEEGQPVPENSSAITDWKKLKNNMTLASTDLVKAYLAYSIPAGALNETNQTARYRLPANIHLTDDQIQAINRTENGVAAAFAAAENGSGNDSGNGNSESAADGSENTDSGITGAGEADAAAGYEKYLGAEAVEGTRTPDKTLREGAQEYISATVRAENVYEGMLDENGNYIDFAGTQASPASDRKDLGDYIGQDLIFTFTPYTVQKNQNTYDMEGNPLTAGEKVTGWFAVDFNMDQIDWVEEDTDLDKSTVEKSAEVIFALEDAGIGSKERKTTLRLEEQAPVGENGAEDTAGQDKDAEDAEKAADHTDGTLTADGDGYSITLDYTADAQIPENASLSVKEITPDTDPEAYEACLQQAAQKMGASIPESGNAGTNADANTGAAGDAADAAKADAPALDTAASRFFDIEIVVTNDDGKTEKIEPKAPVAVNIQLSSAPQAAKQDKADNAVAKSAESGKSGEETSVDSTQKADPTVLHFAEEGVEEMDATVAAPAEGNIANSKKDESREADENQAENAAGTTEISFEAEAFSIYGVVYTVDFHYENGDENEPKSFDFSINGGDSVTLSELVEVLGILDDTKYENIEAFLDAVEDVQFSDESLVKVSKKLIGNNWVLKSLEPFTTEENLTITMKNGDVITVKVTDAQGDPLDGALTSVSIDGAYSDDGRAWEVQKEQNYKLSFSFKEIAGDPNKQINVDNAGGVYLTLPAEFSAMNLENQPLDISENGAPLSGNTYSVRNGKLYLNLTDDTKNKIRTGNAIFDIDITGSFTQSKEKMEFSSNVKRDVTVREDHDLDINKSASYQGWDNRIKYVVTVKSTGYNKNISISDVISGSGVVLDDGANYGVTVSSSSGTSSTTIHADKKGFDTVISSLNDGETVTITYYGKPNDSVNGAEPSMSLTGNTATAKTGTVEKDAPAYVTNKISWDNISKSAGQSSGEGTEKTLPWTITVNSNKGKDMSGAVVKDQIASDNMVYDTTTPITITVYEANPNDVWNDVQKDSFTVNWSQVTLSADQKSFEYTLPDTAGNYKYVISYNTKVTVPTDSISDVTVNNNSSVTKDGKTDTTGGTGSVGPAQNVDLKKSVEKVSGDTVEWEISFKVPTTGLSKAIITDTFPNEWLDDARYRDTLDSSYDITVQEMVNGELSALQKGDTYSIDTSSAEKVVITFSKSDGSAGMTGDESAEREIVIKLKTKFNETWLERKPADGHKNTVNLNDVITAEATANPSAEKSLTKTAKAVGKININGTEYPIYKYSLVITGLSGDTLEIEDSFDSDLEYFNIYGQANNVTNQYSGLGIKYTWDETFHATSGDSQQWRTLPSTFIESNPTWNYIEGLRGYTLNTGEAGKVSFRVATSNLPQNNGILYDSYSFDYYLIAKNLDSLNDRSKQAGKAIELSNTATWKGDEDTSSTAKVEYQYPALEKTMIGLGANANNNEIDRGTLETAHAFAKFQIVVNPERTILPVDETTGKIKLTDTFEKLSVDYSTIKIEIEDTNGTRHDVTTATDYNYSGHTGTFNLDNETKYVITYMARIVGDGTVSFNNTAIIDGYKSRVDESATVSSSGGGTVKNYNVRIYKYSGSNMNEAVPGAEYTLVDENGDPILRPSTTKTLTNGKAGTEIKFITDSTGYANVFLSEEDDGISLQEGIKYYLKETRAPEGYQVNPTIYNFTISEHPNYDNTTNYEYYINDILKIWDNKLEGVLEIDKGVTIDGIDSGNSLTDEQKKNIVFTISGSLEDGSTFETRTVDYSSFRNGKYRLENLKPGTYTVTETNYNLTGFTHTDTQATTSDQTSGASVSDYTYTFTIAENETAGTEHVVNYTNSYTSVPYNFTVQKIDHNNKKLYGAEFKLETKVDGNYVPLQNGSLDSEGKFSIPYEARENGVTIYNLTDGEYRLTETRAPSGYRATAGEFTFKIENGKLVNPVHGSLVQYTPNAEGTAGTAVITNTVEYGYTLTKAEEGAVTTRLPGAKFAVYEFDTTKKDRKGNLVEELTTGANGQIEILKSNNSAYVNNKLYFVVETEAPKGYQLNSKRFYFFWGNYDQGPLHNYDANASAANLGTAQMYSLVEDTPKTVDLKVKKTWNSADIIPAGTTSIDFVVYRTESTPGQDVVTKRYPDNDTVFTLSKGANDSDTVWTKLTNEELLKNLPVGKSEDGVHTSYTYTIEEVSQFEGLESKVQYTSDHNGEQYNIINRPESSEITIHKVWVDGGNDKTSQQVVLCRRNSQGKDTSFARPWDSPYTIDGGDFGNSNNGNIEITLKKVNDWTATVSALEKGPASDPWIYYVEEPAIPADYTFSVSDPVSSGTITVTNTKKTTGIAVHKVWDLAEDEEVPESVTVQLMKAGEVEDSDAVHIQYYFYADWGTGPKHDLTIKNGSTFSIGHGGLSGDYKIDSGSGTVSFESSKMTISDASDGLVIGMKDTWGYDNLNEEKEYVSAVSPDPTNGTPVSGKTLTLTATNWYGEWKGLDDGYYYITETKVGNTELTSSGYEVTYSNNDGIKTGTITATNTKTEPQTGKIIVKKSFKGVTGNDLTTLQNALTITVTGKDVGGTGNNTLELHWSDVQDEGKTIDNLPLNEKYQITESITGDNATTVLGKYEQVTTGTDASVTSFTDVEPTVEGVTKELVNSYEQTADFEFGKQWIDIGQQEIEWDQDIQVTVNRNKADGNKDSSFSLVYTVAKGEVNSAAGGTVEFSTGTEGDPKLKLTITTEEGKKKYKFKIENLAYSGETDGKYTYYAEETNSQLAGYLAPSYWNIGAPTGGTAAYDDGIIINKQEGGYELPSTGGPGTNMIYLFGLLLTGLAGIGLMIKKWRRSAIS